MKRKLRKMKTGLVLLMVLGTTASCGGEELKAFVAGKNRGERDEIAILSGPGWQG